MNGVREAANQTELGFSIYLYLLFRSKYSAANGIRNRTGEVKKEKLCYKNILVC